MISKCGECLTQAKVIVGRELSGFWRHWQSFWFSPVSLYNISLFRFILGFSLLAMYLIRYTEFSFFFTEAGIVPVADALRILPDGYASKLPFFLKTDTGIQIQGVVHLILLALFTLGVFGRSLTWLLAVVNLGLMQRNISIIYGADLFANFWLFYLAFVNHNQHFSIWNWLRKGRTRLAETDVAGTVGVRLIQIQLCLSYAYTGLEKFKGTSWWEGSAVWHVIGMEELVAMDFSFMQNFPVVIAALSMLTVIFEVYFIFAVWRPRLKYLWLAIGFGFHMSTAIFMDLWFFAFVMVSVYLLFLPDARLWRLYLKKRTVDAPGSGETLIA